MSVCMVLKDSKTTETIFMWLYCNMFRVVQSRFITTDIHPYLVFRYFEYKNLIIFVDLWVRSS